MSGKMSTETSSYRPWRVISDVALFLAVLNVVMARPPTDMPLTPSVDPFAPPPSPPTNYAPQYTQQVQYSQQQQQQYQQPTMTGSNAFPMPQQQQPQQSFPQMNYNVQPRYNSMGAPNSQPIYPAINPLPPPDAAPVGATAPGTSSQGEIEFESGGNGGSGSGWGSGSISNYIYPVDYPQAYPRQPGQYSPPSLLDAYYQTPYRQGMNYYQYQMAQRRRNDMFGGMFGGTPSGNMFGALMLNELVF